MQAIDFLKQQHGEAKASFEEIEGASPGRRRALWDKLRPELELHEKMEETHLYGPVAREVPSEKAFADWERSHHSEVEEAETLIQQIGRIDPSDDRWLATVKKLHGALKQHIETEEEDIWPAIERVWDAARLEKAGHQMEAMKKKAAAA